MPHRHPKPPFVPPPSRETIRQRLEELLEQSPMTAKEISSQAGISEKEVAFHLEHLQQSLRNGPRKLNVEPAQCCQCGFSFQKRQRLDKPGRCPLCRSERIDPPRFAID